MLALVKKPRIEISLHGEQVDDLIEWIKKKFEVSIIELLSNDFHQKPVDVKAVSVYFLRIMRKTSPARAKPKKTAKPCE